MKWEEGKTSVKNKKRNSFGSRRTKQGREGRAASGGGRQDPVGLRTVKGSDIFSGHSHGEN